MVDFEAISYNLYINQSTHLNSNKSIDMTVYFSNVHAKSQAKDQLELFMSSFAWRGRKLKPQPPALEANVQQIQLSSKKTALL